MSRLCNLRKEQLKQSMPIEKLKQKLDINSPVKVYWNYNKKNWSVQQGGKVVSHLESIKLKNVTFQVSEAGRQRVLSQKRKNVHAFACGRISNMNPKTHSMGLKREVCYNPYRRMYFFEKESKKSIRPTVTVPVVVLTKEGKVFIPT